MTAQTRRNRATVLSILAIVGGMTLLVVYSVDLYRLFCQATGFGGTTQRAEGKAPVTPGSRVITVRFQANINPSLDWRFYPVEREVKVRVGERKLAYYMAISKADRSTTGVATFNVTPQKAGIYFTKIACFCFDQQRLKPGQKVNMPVSFYIDPAITKDRNMHDVRVITLSYTFFPAAKSAETRAAGTGRTITRNKSK